MFKLTLELIKAYNMLNVDHRELENVEQHVHAGTAVRGLVAFSTRLWQKERGYGHNFLFVKQKINF